MPARPSSAHAARAASSAQAARAASARPAAGGRRRVVAGTVAALLDLALPRTCAVCGFGGQACCSTCLLELSHALRQADRAPRLPETGPPVWAACAYGGVAAALLVAYKDADRRDVLPTLAPPLEGSLARALAWAPWPGDAPPIVVPVPSSAAAVRRRGDRPLERLTAEAAGRLGHARVVDPVLRVRRRVVDQAGLGRAARAANVRGAFEVTAARRVTGRGVVVVDDVVTTGATLAEAERALLAAGAVEVRAAVVAVTEGPRRARRRLSLPRAVD